MSAFSLKFFETNNITAISDIILAKCIILMNIIYEARHTNITCQCSVRNNLKVQACKYKLIHKTLVPHYKLSKLTSIKCQ